MVVRRAVFFNPVVCPALGGLGAPEEKATAACVFRRHGVPVLPVEHACGNAAGLFLASVRHGDRHPDVRLVPGHCWRQRGAAGYRRCRIERLGRLSAIGHSVRDHAGDTDPDHAGAGTGVCAQAFFRLCAGQCLSGRRAGVRDHVRADRWRTAAHGRSPLG